MELDHDRLREVLLHIRRSPAMWRIGTHRELEAFLVGVGLASDLLPREAMLDWMMAQGDPRWGRRGGPGWPTRAAASVVPDHHERRGAFTEDEEAAMCAAIIDVALEWLDRPRPA